MKYYLLSIFIFLININLLFSQVISFEKNIGPMVFKHCANCHQNGEIGPFPLLSYEDVVNHSQIIEEVITKKLMPPWPADPTFSHFANENYLTDAEIEAFKTWKEQGYLKGKKIKYKPFAYENDKLNASVLGKPDLILKFPEPIHLAGNNKESFFLIKVPFQLNQDTNVRYIRFVPDKRKLVHHVSSYLLSYKYNDKNDIFAGKKTYNMESDLKDITTGEELNIRNFDGTQLDRELAFGWVPGSNWSILPEGIGGYRLSKQGVFVVNMHYTSTPVDEIDHSEIHIYFSKTKIKRLELSEQHGTIGSHQVKPKLVIPPDSIKTFYVTSKIPHDISILSVNPHMHNLGKKFLAYAVRPNGDTIPIIRINNWDFNYQYTYKFKKVIKLEKGCTMYIEAVYDNTASNPRNPFNPPRTVSALPDGQIMRTTDEMLNFELRFMKYKVGDENISLE